MEGAPSARSILPRQGIVPSIPLSRPAITRTSSMTLVIRSGKKKVFKALVGARALVFNYKQRFSNSPNQGSVKRRTLRATHTPTHSLSPNRRSKKKDSLVIQPDKNQSGRRQNRSGIPSPLQVQGNGSLKRKPNHEDAPCTPTKKNRFEVVASMSVDESQLKLAFADCKQPLPVHRSKIPLSRHSVLPWLRSQPQYIVVEPFYATLEKTFERSAEAFDAALCIAFKVCNSVRVEGKYCITLKEEWKRAKEGWWDERERVEQIALENGVAGNFVLHIPESIYPETEPTVVPLREFDLDSAAARARRPRTRLDTSCTSRFHLFTAENSLFGLKDLAKVAFVTRTHATNELFQCLLEHATLPEDSNDRVFLARYCNQRQVKYLPKSMERPTAIDLENLTVWTSKVMFGPMGTFPATLLHFSLLLQTPDDYLKLLKLIIDNHWIVPITSTFGETALLTPKSAMSEWDAETVNNRYNRACKLFAIEHVRYHRQIDNPLATRFVKREYIREQGQANAVRAELSARCPYKRPCIVPSKLSNEVEF